MERFLAESLLIGTKTVHATFQIFNGVDYHTFKNQFGKPNYKTKERLIRDYLFKNSNKLECLSFFFYIQN